MSYLIGEYGQCVVCHAFFALKRDGTIWRHFLIPRVDGLCSGVGLKPLDKASDSKFN